MKLTSRFTELIHRRYGPDLPPQHVIAKDLGISQPTVSAWLYGMPRRLDADTLERICLNMPCAPGELLVLES